MSNNKQCQFEASTHTSSSTICKWCGQEKWQHDNIMSKNNQSSIEWLQEQFEESYSYINEIFKETIEQAKAMHKQEIIDAFFEGAYGGDNISGEEYYKETFNNE